MTNKSYLFIGDIKIIEIISQANQTNIAKNHLSALNHTLSFSIFENPENADSLISSKKRIIEEKDINGVAFFSLIQLCYLEKLDFKFLDLLIDLKLEVIFIRENVTIDNKKKYMSLKKKLSLFVDNNQRLINKFYNLGR